MRNLRKIRSPLCRGMHESCPKRTKGTAVFSNVGVAGETCADRSPVAQDLIAYADELSSPHNLVARSFRRVVCLSFVGSETLLAWTKVRA